MKIRDGQATKVTSRDHPLFKDVICMKGAYAPKSFAHPDRLMFPLRRKGARGEGGWERMSWISGTANGMADEVSGEDVEFEAAELALYRRHSP